MRTQEPNSQASSDFSPAGPDYPQGQGDWDTGFVFGTAEDSPAWGHTCDGEQAWAAAQLRRGKAMLRQCQGTPPVPGMRESFALWQFQQVQSEQEEVRPSLAGGQPGEDGTVGSS